MSLEVLSESRAGKVDVGIMQHQMLTRRVDLFSLSSYWWVRLVKSGFGLMIWHTWMVHSSNPYSKTMGWYRTGKFLSPITVRSRSRTWSSSKRPSCLHVLLWHQVGRALLILALISASACFVLTWRQKDGWPEMDTDRSKYAWTLR